ncbi:hypothetical protein A5724_18060 [Mycobacterium sp. ACS1612]|nr:hypothetical protein A5724_18060 [Mycobacterium sp. ACS1612]
MAEHVTIPVIASNRINMPEAAEQILADGNVQLISVARPLLSDPMRRAKQVAVVGAGPPDWRPPSPPPSAAIG